MKLTFACVSTRLWAAGAGVAVMGWMPAVLAQTSHYYAGLSVEGQPIMVDLYSPEKVSDQAINFVYALGDEQISGQANCSGSSDERTWITLDDGVVHTPQSSGTQNMLALVCGYSTLSAASNLEEPVALYPSMGREPEQSVSSNSSGDSSELEAIADSSLSEPAIQTALVFDPPSNVRATPGGSILCSVDANTQINIYGHSGSWYETDVCGQMGVIDISQIEF